MDFEVFEIDEAFLEMVETQWEETQNLLDEEDQAEAWSFVNFVLSFRPWVLC